MVNKLPFISVIIPAKNEEKLIVNCIDSLNKLDYPKDRYEIIVADGLSTDNTVLASKEMGAIIVKNEKQTVSPGRNIGFQYSKGELIAFTDADCIADRNWLKKSIKYFQQDETIACVGGPNLTPDDETIFGKGVGFVLDQAIFSAGSIHARELKEIKAVVSIPGCNAIYRRSVLEKVMPLDETMLTCDDTKLNRAIIDMGFKLLYTPDVFVWHYRRPTPVKLWKQFYRYAVGRLQVGKKNRKMINLVHICIGLSFPLLLAFLILLYKYNIYYLSLFLTVILLCLLYFAIIGMLKWKSFWVGASIPFIILLIMAAWSCGFMRELVFPMKRVEGK